MLRKYSVQNKCKGTLVTLPLSSGLYFLIKMLSLICNKNLPPPPPMNSKSSLDTCPHFPSDLRVCCMGAKICIPLNCFPVRAEICVCSSSLFSQYLAVYPMQLSVHLAHVYLYKTPDLRDFGKESLYLKYDESLLEVLKTTLMFQKGRIFLNDRVRLFFTYVEVVPMKGSIIETSILGTVCTGSLVL